MNKTVYKKIDYDLAGLISDIKIGNIALPDYSVLLSGKMPKFVIYSTPCIADFRLGSFYSGSRLSSRVRG